MSQNEHFTGIWGILWILWVILQVCFSELYSSVYNQFQDGGCVSLRAWWVANNISGNFAKFSPNCSVFSCCVVLWIYSLWINVFCWCNNNERTNQVELLRLFTRNTCMQRPLAYIFQTLFQHEVFVIMPTLNAGSRCHVML